MWTIGVRVSELSSSMVTSSFLHSTDKVGWCLVDGSRGRDLFIIAVLQFHHSFPVFFCQNIFLIFFPKQTFGCHYTPLAPVLACFAFLCIISMPYYVVFLQVTLGVLANPRVRAYLSEILSMRLPLPLCLPVSVFTCLCACQSRCVQGAQ